MRIALIKGRHGGLTMEDVTMDVEIGPCGHEPRRVECL